MPGSISLAFAMMLAISQQPSLPDITYQNLLDGFKNPSRWLMYSGDYTGRRHSALTQITPDNVGRQYLVIPSGLKVLAFALPEN